MLASKGYFIESNQALLDPITQKSREIDLVAEYFDEHSVTEKLATMSQFVFEIKNNAYPLVLLTKMGFSPDVAIWEGLREAITVPVKNLDYNSDFYEELMKIDWDMFTQYCSFQKKQGKDELMAIHPDEIYSGISKIVQYCDQAVNRFGSLEDYVFRHFLFLPVLLIKDDLYELEFKKMSPHFKKVEISKLVYSYHFGNEQRVAIIFVMTKKGLDKFLPQIQEVEKTMRGRIQKILKVQKAV